MTDALLLWLALACGAAVLGWRWRVGAAARLAQRGRLLEAAGGLIQIDSTRRLASGFMRVEGQDGEARVILNPILDTLSARKLPVLWLSLTRIEPLPVTGSFNVMMRPSSTEVFSRFHELPITLDTPAGFPETCQVRCDGPGPYPPAELIARHLRPFHDGRAKELLITAQGIRIVWLVAEGERSNYLLFRDSEFGVDALPRGDLAFMLEAARALAGDIQQEQNKRQAL
jgi:hypothetical protein